MRRKLLLVKKGNFFSDLGLEGAALQKRSRFTLKMIHLSSRGWMFWRASRLIKGSSTIFK